jgi:hypothetical protein
MNFPEAEPQRHAIPYQTPATVQTSPPVSSPVIILWTSSPPPFLLEIARKRNFFSTIDISQLNQSKITHIFRNKRNVYIFSRFY